MTLVTVVICMFQNLGLMLMRTHGVIYALSSSGRSGACAASDNDDEGRSAKAALRC